MELPHAMVVTTGSGLWSMDTPRLSVPSRLILHCARRFRALGELLGRLRSRRDAAGAGADAARPAARGGDDIGAYSLSKALSGSFYQPPGRKAPAGACAGGSRVTPGGGQVVRAARARRSRCRWASGVVLG